MRELEESVVAVTGGTRGIGAAVARHLAGDGADVFICGRTTEGLERVAAGSGRIAATEVDIRDESDVEAWIDEIDEKRGRLDVLINNAGVLGPRERLDETDVAAWRETIDVNINGTFLVIRAAYRLLRASTAPLMINVSSSVGRSGRGRWGAYSVSKFGVEGLAEVAADELAEDGCVVTLNPGGTATDMRAEAYPDEDPETLPDPEDVAETMGVLVRGLTPEQNGRKYSSSALFDLVDETPTGDEIPTADWSTGP